MLYTTVDQVERSTLGTIEENLLVDQVCLALWNFSQPAHSVIIVVSQPLMLSPMIERAFMHLLSVFVPFACPLPTPAIACHMQLAICLKCALCAWCPMCSL